MAYGGGRLKEGERGRSDRPQNLIPEGSQIWVVKIMGDFAHCKIDPQMGDFSPLGGQKWVSEGRIWPLGGQISPPKDGFWGPGSQNQASGRPDLEAGPRK